MRKIKQFIKTKLDSFAIKRFKTLAPIGLITQLYKTIAKNNLDITTQEVNVKKGKRRYTLLIAKDKECKTTFNLGRH